MEELTKHGIKFPNNTFNEISEYISADYCNFVNETNTTNEIISELYKTCKKLGAKSDLLSIIGSYNDTLTQEEILNYLEKYNLEVNNEK